MSDSVEAPPANERERWIVAIALVACGLVQPTLAFGISGYLLYPDWDNQTALSRAFDPIFVVMLVAGLVATMIGTVVLPISRAQRAIGLPLALLLYAGAFLAGSVIGCVLWGLPID